LFGLLSFFLQYDADNDDDDGDDDDYDLQNAGFSEFQIPDIAIASALYTNIPTLDQIRVNISEHEAGNLEALQMSPLAHCVPGQNISDFNNVLRTMGIGNHNHLLRSFKSA
jgi:hypothetical protein